MRSHGSAVLALLATNLISSTSAGLIPDLLRRFEDLQNVHKRCENPCGYYGQVCCQQGESCYTDSAGEAQCGAGAVGGGDGNWQYYTTTYVQTDLKTVTQTFSSYIPVTTPAPTSSGCSYSMGETPCGSTCCHAGQFCQADNMCVQDPGGSSGYYSSLYTVTTVVTNTASAPLRPTSDTIITLTSNGAATVTTAFQTPVPTDGAILTGGSTSSSGGLSGGAIAGIVIGVIAGIILLLLLCACCCFKGLLDGLLAIFGLGPRRKRRTEVIEEERYSHRHGSRTGGRTWFGMGPRKTEVVEEKRHDSGWRRAGGVAAALGGLALILGLKRRRDRRDDKTSSSYSYYDSDYYTSSSSSSSGGRRTRGSRSRSRSRVSRGTSRR